MANEQQGSNSHYNPLETTVEANEEYMSLFHGGVASYNKILEGNSLLDITVSKLVEENRVLGQHQFIPMEEGIVYDIALWMPEHRPQGPYEVQTETVPGVRTPDEDFFARVESQRISDQARIQEIRSLLAQEVSLHKTGEQ